MSSTSTDYAGLLTTTDIGSRLGHNPIVSSFIIEVLQVPPEKTHMRAKYWTEEQFQTICQRLAAHAQAVASLHGDTKK